MLPLNSRPIALLAVIAIESVSAVAAVPSPSPAGVTIIGCMGHYLKIDFLRGNAVDSDELVMIAPDNARVDGCLFSSGAYDKSTGVLYGIFAKEARADMEDRRHFKLVALDPASMAEIKHFDIPELQSNPPKLALWPEKQLIELQVGDRTIALSARRDSLLKAAGEARPRPPSAPEPLPSQSGISLLDAATRKRFESLIPPNPQGPESNYVRHISRSASGRVLYVLAPDVVTPSRVREAPSRASGLFVYDYRAKRIVSAFNPRFVVATGNEGSTALLSPDGRRVIVEQYERRILSGQESYGPRVVKSGQLAIYDADSGTLQSLVALRTGPEFGHAEPISFSAESQLMYYRWNDTFYVVDLAAGSVKASAPFKDGPVFTMDH